MLRATLFDFYGTLAEVPREGGYQTINNWLEIVRAAGKEITLKEGARIGTQLWEDYSLGRMQSDREYVEKFLDIVGIAKSEDIINKLLETWVARRLFVVYPETTSVIAEIKKMGLKIGVISDSPVPWFKNHIIQAGIEKLVDATVVSGEIGSKKPNPQIYMKALEKLQSEPLETVFISDAPSDLLGAHKVGIERLVLVSPSSKPYRVGEQAKDSFKEKFMELEELKIKPIVVKNLRETPNVIKGFLKP
jgi:HAD superfamily hydrolase (TIGR01509 family)